jgi:hypothetical protein
MGLDMYLCRKTYVKHWKDEAKVLLTVPEQAHDDVKAIQPDRVKYVIEVVAYWRKANAIHKWFVDNFADGVDECQEIPVTAYDLSTLISLCEQVLETREVAGVVLPTTSGFFFGSTEYDDGYYEDLQNTVDMLKPVLAEDPNGYGDYYYQASW